MSSESFITQTPFQTIVMTGVDRHDFLQRLSTRNYRNPKPNDFFPGAFLNANGTVVSLFYSWIRENEVLLLVEAQSAQKTLAFLEKFHFAEQIQFALNPDWHWFELRGPSLSKVENSLRLPDWPRTEEWREGGLVGLPNLVAANEFKNSVKALGFVEWPVEKWQFYRAKNFVPEDQVDIGETQIILEAGLYAHVSRNKGCYPGQEVVERLFTYGNVAKKLVLLEERSEKSFSPNSEVFREGKKVGQLTSVRVYNGETLAMAIIQRTSAKLNEDYQIQNSTDQFDSMLHAVMIAPDVPKD